MTQFFLRAKPWQIFLLICILPPLGYFLLLIIMMTPIFGKQILSHGFINSFSPSFMTFMISYQFILILPLFGWFWSLTIGLQRETPQELQVNLWKFKLFFIFSLVYTLFIITGIDIFVSKLSNINYSNFYPVDYRQFLNIGILYLAPLHLFAVFCFFHTISFTARSYKTAITLKQIEFKDFVLEFLLFFFFPIGILAFQPQINSIIESENDVLIKQIIE